jgi:hypothetical protein
MEPNAPFAPRQGRPGVCLIQVEKLGVRCRRLRAPHLRSRCRLAWLATLAADAHLRAEEAGLDDGRRLKVRRSNEPDNVATNGEYFFLKTIIPSRKATRDYLKTGAADEPT